MHSSTHFAITDDGAVVFDVEHDRMLKLNATGAEMWKLLALGFTADQVIETIAKRFGVHRERVENDLLALVRRGKDLGISPQSIFIPKPIKPEAANPKPPSISAPLSSAKIPDVIKANVGLIFFDVVLWCTSLRHLTSIVQKWPLKNRREGDESSAISRVLAAVESASVWYPKTALCLQRSAVTTCLMRSNGVHANMVVGVRPMPFLAHAWVEVHGRVVNDLPRVKSFYQPITCF